VLALRLTLGPFRRPTTFLPITHAGAGMVPTEVWYPRVALTSPWKGLAMWVRLALAAAFCGIADSAVAQSFDCAKAQTRVEKMICGSCDRGAR
jgi:hypothetical protein